MSLLSRHASPPSNAQLTALLDGVDELLLLLDARQRVSLCNRAAQRLLGCEPGQAPDAAFAQLDPASRQALLAALRAGQPSQRLALRIDGQALPLSATLARAAGTGWTLRAPLSPPSPALPRLAPGATTELVHLLWDSPQPLLVQDASFVVVGANRALCEALGLPPDQLLGRDPIGLLSLDLQAEEQQLREDLLAALAAGRQPPFQVERRVADAQGRERWFRHAPRWVSADDGAPLMLAILQDVTLEHQARHQAERSGHELDQWFDLSPIGMLVYDASGLVVRSNSAFEALVGRAPGAAARCPARPVPAAGLGRRGPAPRAARGPRAAGGAGRRAAARRSAPAPAGAAARVSGRPGARCA